MTDRERARPPQPRAIRVELPGDIAEALSAVAVDEHRPLANQVVVFVRDRLRQVGALPPHVPPYRTAATGPRGTEPADGAP